MQKQNSATTYLETPIGDGGDEVALADAKVQAAARLGGSDGVHMVTVNRLGGEDGQPPRLGITFRREWTETVPDPVPATTKTAPTAAAASASAAGHVSTKKK